MDRGLQKMAKLESELKRLIAAVDERLPITPLDRVRSPGRCGSPVSHQRLPGWTFSQAGAVAGVAVLLLTAGWATSSLFYSSRLKSQVEDEIRPYAKELKETVDDIQTDLAPKLASADELKVEINRARHDLTTRGDTIEAVILTAQDQLLNIRDTAIDDIERRLTDQSDDLTSMLDLARARAVKLDKSLNELSQAVAALEHQIPTLTNRFSDLASYLATSQAKIEKARNEASLLDGVAPTLLDTIANHQSKVDAGTKTLAILQTQLEALKGQTARSSRQLEQVLVQGRDQITNWQDMDREVDQRKLEVMHNLDLYAESLNNHMREFLDVLNDETVFTGG